MFAAKTDLYTLYAMCAADEAVKDSGIEGKIDPDELSVYLGSGVGGVNTLCEEHAKCENQGPRRVSPQFVPKMIINIAAGQIAIKYKAHGNAMCISTACATGTSVLGEAYRAIKDGYTTAAICGGCLSQTIKMRLRSRLTQDAADLCSERAQECLFLRNTNTLSPEERISTVK